MYMICMICYCLLFVIIGHSRRKNVFLYGCSPALSWLTDDVDNPAVLGDKSEDSGYKV